MPVLYIRTMQKDIEALNQGIKPEDLRAHYRKTSTPISFGDANPQVSTQAKTPTPSSAPLTNAPIIEAPKPQVTAPIPTPYIPPAPPPVKIEPNIQKPAEIVSLQAPIEPPKPTLRHIEPVQKTTATSQSQIQQNQPQAGFHILHKDAPKSLFRLPESGKKNKLSAGESIKALLNKASISLAPFFAKFKKSSISVKPATSAPSPVIAEPTKASTTSASKEEQTFQKERAKTFYQEAKILYKKGNWPESIVKLNNALQSRPNWWKAKWLISRNNKAIKKASIKAEKQRSADLKKLQKQKIESEKTAIASVPKPVAQKSAPLPVQLPQVATPKEAPKQSQAPTFTPKPTAPNLGQILPPSQKPAPISQPNIPITPPQAQPTQTINQDLASEIKQIKIQIQQLTTEIKQEERQRQTTEQQLKDSILKEEISVQETLRRLSEDLKQKSANANIIQTRPTVSPTIDQPRFKTTPPPVNIPSVPPAMTKPATLETPKIKPILSSAPKLQDKSISIPKEQPRNLKAILIPSIATVVLIIAGFFTYQFVVNNSSTSTTTSIINIQEPTLLINTSQKLIININPDDPKSASLVIKKILQDQYKTGEIRAVLIKNQNGEYLSLEQLSSALGLNIPSDVKSKIGPNYTLALYTNKTLSASPFITAYGANRLLLIAQVQSESTFNSVMSWENAMAFDLATILPDKNLAKTTQFNDGVYQNISLRYANLIDDTIALDWSISNNRLIIATSKESMRGALDTLK